MSNDPEGGTEMKKSYRSTLCAIGILMLIVALTLPNTVFADGGPYPEAFGTSGETCVTTHAFAFNPEDSSAGYSIISNELVAVEDNTWFGASVNLPTGAKLVSAEFDGWDTSGSQDIRFCFQSLQRGGGGTNYGCVDSSGTPGSIQLSIDLTGDEITVDNANNAYFVKVKLGDNIFLRLRSVRIFYQLQISPAPSTASFSDVPTDYWAFREIEALADSGITTGCATGLYCPEDYVTRAQMAAFFSRALGLYYPDR